MSEHPFRRKMDWALISTILGMVTAFIVFTVKIINAHSQWMDRVAAVEKMEPEVNNDHIDILLLKQAIYDMKDDVKFIKNRVR